MTGTVLDIQVVREAMQEEIAFMTAITVRIRDETLNPKAIRDYVRTKWVITNEGSDTDPDVRARLLGCEVSGSGALVTEY